MGGRAAGAALCHDIPRAAFALSALGGDTQLELNLVETHARMGMARDVAVRDSAADTNDHGMGLLVRMRTQCGDYKCESIVFANRLPRPFAGGPYS